MQKKRIAIIASVLLVGGCGVAAANGGGDTPTASEASRSDGPLTLSTNEKNPPAADVKLTTCRVDSTLQLPEAKLKVTNHSSKPSDYLINVEFLDRSGTRVAETAAMQSALSPGKSALTEAMGDNQVKGKVTCKVTKVDRFATNGG